MMPVKSVDDQVSNMEEHDISSPKAVATVPSILSTMNHFISAVEDMDDTVLIPSRLRDMPAGHFATQGTTPENGTSTVSQGKEIVPHTQPQIDTKNGNDISLYSHYSILKALRTELVSGPAADEDVEMDNEDDDIASKKLQIATARMLRHHLNGVVNTMQQLTLMCDKVTDRYRSEFDNTQTNGKVNTFSM